MTLHDRIEPHVVAVELDELDYIERLERDLAQHKRNIAEFGEHIDDMLRSFANG